MLLHSLFAVVFVASYTLASAPTVTLDNATFTGFSSGNVSQFLGIPYARPPTGDLRFRAPVSILPYNTSQTYDSFGASCPQQTPNLTALSLSLPNSTVVTEILQVLTNISSTTNTTSESEDCLTINVITPTGASPSSKLPVVAWIYGGGFEIGTTSQYDGSSVVERSIELGQSIIYVSMNYRINAFGFLASKEVKAAGLGNFGLLDQRESFRWIQKYIGAFGGDPSKVTVWGQSAGAASIGLHMVANNGNNEGLFRAAFMESGSPTAVGNLTGGQQYYDSLASQTNCTSVPDTLECLRKAPYVSLKTAVDNTPNLYAYQSVNRAWKPRVDGTFLTDKPESLVQKGIVTNVPFVSGDVDDEGTLFSLVPSLNVTTSDQFETYIQTVIAPQITDSQIQQISVFYPDDPTQGSPYNTSGLNEITPQYKRISAVLGDLSYQAPRRFFMQSQSGKQPIWAFLSKRMKATPIVGSYHASDLNNIYSGGELTDYLVHFVTNLDPNGGDHLSWPQYNTTTQQLMTFLDGTTPLAISLDNYREDAMALLIQVNLEMPY